MFEIDVENYGVLRLTMGQIFDPEMIGRDIA